LIFIFNEVPTWSDEEIMTVGFFVNNTFAGVAIKDLFSHFFFSPRLNPVLLYQVCLGLH